MSLDWVRMSFNEINTTWSDGGILMLPLFVLAVYIYYTALKLFTRLHTHAIVRCKVLDMSDSEITGNLLGHLKGIRHLIWMDAPTIQGIQRHFDAVRNAHLPVINRRIRFLSITITIGPLMGLLGTVMGMLSTFNGMVAANGSKFENIVRGVSEALITTQTGLIISIPAFILLAFIVQKRAVLAYSISRLEQYNTCLFLRSEGCVQTKGSYS